MKEEIQLNGEEFFPNLNRRARFWGRAKSNGDGSWKIHCFADYIEDMDIERSFLPVKDLSKLYNQWWSQVRRKGKFK